MRQLLLLLLFLLTCNGLPPPKIKLAYLCTRTSLFKNSDCIYRKDLLRENHDLVKSIEKWKKFSFNDQQDKTILLGVICTAPYPVEWEHYQEKFVGDIAGDQLQHVLSLQITAHQRVVKDIEDPDTFTYSSLRVLSNYITVDSNYVLGEHVCKGLEEGDEGPSKSVKLKVFRKRSVFDRVFPLSNKTLEISLEDKREDGSVVLPCHVSDPNVKVFLHRKVHKGEWSPMEGMKIFHKITQNKFVFNEDVLNTTTTEPPVEKWDLVRMNDHLQFVPQLGFVYQTVGTKNPFYFQPGTYKCSAYTSNSTLEDDSSSSNLQADDEVIFIVRKGNGNVENVVSSIQPPAKLHVTCFPNKRFSIKCCSTSNDPPYIFFGVCLSRGMCSREKSYLLKSGNRNLRAHSSTRLSTTKGNCRETLQIQFLSSAARYAIVPHCQGDGINYSETLIFPLDDTKHEHSTALPVPYFGWESVDPYRMVSLKLSDEIPNYINDTLVLYNMQQVTFECYSSLIYFALGSRAIINFKNGSSHLVPDEKTMEEKYKELIDHPEPVRFRFVVNSNITSVSCYAPLAKSSEWIKKTQMIHVIEGTPVQIEGEMEEEVTWIVNDTMKELLCEFSGDPQPELVHWLKGGQVIEPDQNDKYFSNFNITSTQNNVSVLQVKSADYFVHDVYVCEVSNIFGSANKTFQVYVRPSEEPWTVLCSFLGFSCFLLMLGGVGAAAWWQRTQLRRIKLPVENEYAYNAFGR